MVATIVEWLARRLNVPQLAITTFKKANEVSGLGKETIPTELIPLNMIQLSRGLLNFTLLQTIRSWILPYWAEQQYSPHSVAFIPRSHLGLSMNLTLRNWTAVGSMECDIEPVVDPRGMVTPFRDGWSIDLWLMVNGKMFFPSKAETVRQRLVDSYPIVETKFYVQDISAVILTFVKGSRLIHSATVQNNGNEIQNCTVFFAIRPFNPEGISLIHDVEYCEPKSYAMINKVAKVYFSGRADIVHCSTHEKGDCGNLLGDAQSRTDCNSGSCATGLGNAIVGFHSKLAPQAQYSVDTQCALQESNDDQESDDANIVPYSYWKDILHVGVSLRTPDENINSLFTASLTTLLLLVDKESITPGPFTYHHFWFRDAAYMIFALDSCGFAEHTRPIVQGFPKKQHKSGYFRSQQGEWDSNGQALWTAWQHARLSKDKALLEELFPSLVNVVKWIED